MIKASNQWVFHPHRSVDGRVFSQYPLETLLLTSLDDVKDEVGNLERWYTQWEPLVKVSKVAQGSYGTVLRMQSRKKSKMYTIWKMIPLRPRQGKGSHQKDQTFIDDALTELKTLSLLSEIPGFVQFRRPAHVLKGSLPEGLHKVSQDYDKYHPEEVAKHGKNRTDYSEEQLWLLLEMTDAGTDLETIMDRGFPDGTCLIRYEPVWGMTPRQTWDIFWGVSGALANGEVHANFEHRDLHRGNICIKRKKRDASPSASSDTTNSSIKKYTDLEITIIDYTLSRATLANGEVLAISMSDRTLFAQTSENENDNLQYNVYRWMRELVEGERGGAGKDSAKWKRFVPMTNLLWLYYLLTIMLEKTMLPEVPGDSNFMKSFDSVFRKEHLNRTEEDSKVLERLKELKMQIAPENRSVWDCLSAQDLLLHQQLGREEFYHYICNEPDQCDKMSMGKGKDVMQEARLARRERANKRLLGILPKPIP